MTSHKTDLTREKIEAKVRFLRWCMSGSSEPRPTPILSLEDELILCDMALRSLETNNAAAQDGRSSYVSRDISSGTLPDAAAPSQPDAPKGGAVDFINQLLEPRAGVHEDGTEELKSWEVMWEQCQEAARRLDDEQQKTKAYWAVFECLFEIYPDCPVIGDLPGWAEESKKRAEAAERDLGLERESHEITKRMYHDSDEAREAAEEKLPKWIKVSELIGEARKLLTEHWSGNDDWRKGNEHTWIGRADIALENAAALIPPAPEES